MKPIKLTEELLSTGQPIAQGEVNIWMKKYAPKSILKKLEELTFEEFKVENDKFIVGHSETGHCHVLERVKTTAPFHKQAQILIDKANDNFVQLRLLDEMLLNHEKSGKDAHVSYILPAGEYVRGLREEQDTSPAGWRRSLD